MSKSTLRKAQAILSKAKAKNIPPPGIVIIHRGEADCERQLAEWRAKGGKGTVIILPDNGRGRVVDEKPLPRRSAAY